MRNTEIRFALVLLLASTLIIQPFAAGSADAQGRRTQRGKASQTQGLAGDQRLAHVLERLSFGARPGDFERVKALGVDAYIAQQLDPDSIDDSALQPRLAKLQTLMLATPTLAEQYNPPKPAPTPTPSPMPSPSPSPPTVAALDRRAQPAMMAANARTELSMEAQKPAVGEMNKPAASPAEKSPVVLALSTPPNISKPTVPQHNPQQVVTELQRASLLRAVYSERQLYEMMVAFWENHFSIYAQKDADRWLLTGFDREAIRPFALGRFRDLLGATAHSPAMLFYLDNWQSSVERKYPATKDKPARTTGGINENYARELMELHTLGVDGGYTQKDVQEVARCFTGWTIRKPNEEGLAYFNPATHDKGEKIVLGQKIPAGGGIADGERVLDILAHHPSTARFIATKLARRFISDDPPASVINRAAAVFLKTDGSIKETLRAIITSPEFRARAAYRAKVRTPFEYAAATLRLLNAETDGDRPVLDWIGRMGQSVFGRVTPDGYPDREEQWLSTGALLSRFNFASALASNRIKGTRIDVARLMEGVSMDDPHAIAAQLSQLAFDGDLTPQTRSALDKLKVEAVRKADGVNAKQPPAATTSVNAGYARDATAAKNAATPSPPVVQVIILVLGAPEFQRR